MTTGHLFISTGKHAGQTTRPIKVRKIETQRRNFGGGGNFAASLGP